MEMGCCGRFWVDDLGADKASVLGGSRQSNIPAASGNLMTQLRDWTSNDPQLTTVPEDGRDRGAIRETGNLKERGEDCRQ